MSEDVFYTLLIVGLLSLLGFVGDRIFQKTGIPDVLLLLLIGTFIGPYLGLVNLEQISLITPYFGTLVLIFILFDGGLELDFNVILRQFLPVMVLVLLSIITVMGGVASLTIYYFDWHWLPSLILACFLANISGAIVLPVVNGLAIDEDDKSILKLEAAASDVLVILLFVTLMSILEALGTDGGISTFSPRETLSQLAGSFSIAIVIGSAIGTLWILALNRIYRYQHNYMATLGMMLMLYSVSEFLGASGMMAVLFFGIVLANSQRFGHFFNIKEIHYWPHEMKHLHTTFSFLLRTFFLIYIGFFLSAEMLDFSFLKVGILIIAILVIMRGITGVLFARIFKKGKLTTLAVISMLPRGLAVAALATVPGQKVDSMMAERTMAIKETQIEIDRIQENLVVTEDLKKNAQLKNESKEYEKLTKKEIELSANRHLTRLAIAGHETVIGKLSDIKKSTDTFILFAPLSILVTNILMTLGCFYIKKQRPSVPKTQNNSLGESQMMPAESLSIAARPVQRPENPEIES